MFICYIFIFQGEAPVTSSIDVKEDSKSKVDDNSESSSDVDIDDAYNKDNDGLNENAAHDGHAGPGEDKGMYQ